MEEDSGIKTIDVGAIVGAIKENCIVETIVMMFAQLWLKSRNHRGLSWMDSQSSRLSA